MNKQDDDNVGNEKQSVITIQCSAALKAKLVKAAMPSGLNAWIVKVLSREVEKVDECK